MYKMTVEKAGSAIFEGNHQFQPGEIAYLAPSDWTDGSDVIATMDEWVSMIDNEKNDFGSLARSWWESEKEVSIESGAKPKSWESYRNNMIENLSEIEIVSNEHNE